VLLAAMQLQAPSDRRLAVAKEVLGLTWAVERDGQGFKAVNSTHKVVEKHKYGHFYWTSLAAAKLGSSSALPAADDLVAETTAWKAVEKVMTKIRWPPEKIAAVTPTRERPLPWNVRTLSFALRLALLPLPLTRD